MDGPETLLQAAAIGNLCRVRGAEKLRRGDVLFNRGLFPEAQTIYEQGAVQFANAKALIGSASELLDQAFNQPEAPIVPVERGA